MNEAQAKAAIAERRLRRVVVGTTQLAGMVIMKAWAHFKFDMPDDANLTGVYYDPAYDGFFFTFAHSSFSPVEMGEMIPLTAIGAVELRPYRDKP